MEIKVDAGHFADALGKIVEDGIDDAVTEPSVPVECPECGASFTVDASTAECPECGLPVRVAFD